MAQCFTLRTWATPLTISAFLLMSVTGVLMFFHIEGGLTTVAHQWCSWLPRRSDRTHRRKCQAV